jgi:uncharacterized protein YfbU (UPF0304 family)
MATPIKLTRTERWILANQYQILEVLKPDEAEGFAEVRIALERGYELHYTPDHIYAEGDIMSADMCEEVLDILSMHRALHDSFDGLKDKSGIRDRDITFVGFDGNNETTHMAYARYYCGLDGGQARFTELHRGDNFNSHMPVLDMYRRMLRVWRDGLDKKHELTKDDIQHIVAARPYPKG